MKRPTNYLPSRDPLFLIAVGLLIAIFVALFSSCSPFPSGGYRETRPVTTDASPETRRFRVIETTPTEPARPGFRPYSTTQIRTFTVR